jgi:hypothetical protein
VPVVTVKVTPELVFAFCHVSKAALIASRCSFVGKAVGFIMTFTFVPLGHVAPLVLASGAGTAQGTSCAEEKLPTPILTIRITKAAISDEVFGLFMIPKNC